MYARPPGPDGEPLDFGVSGRLWRDSLIMFDRETRTLWSQLLGEAVHGELEGRELEKLPSKRTTWGEWKREHPDTLAAEKPADVTGSPYEKYFQDADRIGIHGNTLRDERLPAKQRVLGLEGADRAVAVALEEGRRGLVKVPLGGRDVVVYRDGLRAAAWDAEGRELKWSRRRGLRDAKTGVRFDPWSGEPVSGEASPLEPVPTTSAYWFAWAGVHPDTAVKGATVGPSTRSGRPAGPQSRPGSRPRH